MLSIFQTGIKFSLICKRPPRICMTTDRLKRCTNNLFSASEKAPDYAVKNKQTHKYLNTVISKNVQAFDKENQKLSDGIFRQLKLPLLHAESVRFVILNLHF